MSYFTNPLISTGVAGVPVTCADNEIVSFDPPAAETCGSYLAEYLGLVGGKLLNYNATRSCEVCTVANTDDVLALLEIDFSDRSQMEEFRHHTRLYCCERWVSFVIILGSKGTQERETIVHRKRLGCLIYVGTLFYLRCDGRIKTFDESVIGPPSLPQQTSFRQGVGHWSAVMVTGQRLPFNFPVIVVGSSVTTEYNRTLLRVTSFIFASRDRSLGNERQICSCLWYISSPHLHWCNQVARYQPFVIGLTQASSPPQFLSNSLRPNA